MKVKNPKIQILRALSIISVVIIHMLPSGLSQVFLRPFLNFAVATFLFLSGYLTNLSIYNWKVFCKKRILRVIIPYIIWTIIYTTISFIGHDLDIKKYIVNLLTANAASTLYYLLVYMQFVLLTPFLSKLIKSKVNWIGWIISPLFLLIKYYWLIFDKVPNKLFSTIYGISCLGWFIFYYLGLLLGNDYIKKKYNIKKIIVFYLISIGLQIAEGYFWYLLGNINCGTQLKLSSILTSLLFCLISYWYINNEKINYKSNCLVLIGNYSFGIYILHLLIMMILRNIIPFWSFIPFYLNVIIVLIVTLLCTIIGKKILGSTLSRYVGLY